MEEFNKELEESNASLDTTRYEETLTCPHCGTVQFVSFMFPRIPPGPESLYVKKCDGSECNAKIYFRLQDKCFYFTE